eukprot:TRINITY_DN20281_c0_g1_i2.p1 TRINITY_DN20281_c0_g1~~TRINITY_DN20281_c0_g1_i2.p1  ORF type:complete len:322 (+),score=84.77 TRINITY_DN20281_c0_g1_i2:132-1097(+)
MSAGPCITFVRRCCCRITGRGHEEALLAAEGPVDRQSGNISFQEWQTADSAAAAAQRPSARSVRQQLPLSDSYSSLGDIGTDSSRAVGSGSGTNSVASEHVSGGPPGDRPEGVAAEDAASRGSLARTLSDWYSESDARRDSISADAEEHLEEEAAEDGSVARGVQRHRISTGGAGLASAISPGDEMYADSVASPRGSSLEYCESSPRDEDTESEDDAEEGDDAEVAAQKAREKAERKLIKRLTKKKLPPGELERVLFKHRQRCDQEGEIYSNQSKLQTQRPSLKIDVKRKNTGSFTMEEDREEPEGLPSGTAAATSAGEAS